VGVPLNLNNTAKYVELSVEGLRTRVRFPPAPPYTDTERCHVVLKPYQIQVDRVFLCLTPSHNMSLHPIFLRVRFAGTFDC